MKRSAVAFVIILLAAVLVVGIIYLRPAAKPSAPPQKKTTKPTAPPVVNTEPPIEVVKHYLEALKIKNYQSAYTYLSSASHTEYSYDKFEAMNKQITGFPEFNMESLQAGPGNNADTLVTIKQYEDPAGHGFHLTLEDGQWKIKFIGGTPPFPYPEK